MKKNLTELIFILDSSGSMSGLESDTVGGFNSLINKHKKEHGECLVSVKLFNTESKLLYDRTDIKNILPLTENDYTPQGCTALYDAVGDEIKKTELIHKYIREEDIPEHTVFVITTDGMENASRKYSLPQIKAMIKQKESENWQFLFLGANINAVETASSMGISEDCAADYHSDTKGTAVMYQSLTEALHCVRTNQKLGRSWKKEVDSDYKNRKNQMR